MRAKRLRDMCGKKKLEKTPEKSKLACRKYSILQSWRIDLSARADYSFSKTSTYDPKVIRTKKIDPFTFCLLCRSGNTSNAHKHGKIPSLAKLYLWVKHQIKAPILPDCMLLPAA